MKMKMKKRSLKSWQSITNGQIIPMIDKVIG